MKNRKKTRLPAIPAPKKIKRYLLSTVFALFCALALWIVDDAKTTHAPQPNSPAELHANQLEDDLTHTFADAIGSAKESVLLIVYSLTDPKIIKSLKEKSLHGVDVKVICDAKASPYIDSKLGAKVATTRRFGPGLMHQKILVIDKQKTWLGSANMTTESLRLHGNLVTSMDSPLVADHIYAKANTLGVEGRGKVFDHKEFALGSQKVELWFLPDCRDASLKLKSLIRSAKKTVRVAMFTWTRNDLAKAVIDAANRGVDTEVVIDHYSGKGASEKIFKLLKINGVKVSLSQGGPLLHHKFLYIDGETLVNGSANWTKAAFTQNDDCFIVIHHLTTPQKNKMDTLWKTIWKEAATLP